MKKVFGLLDSRVIIPRRSELKEALINYMWNQPLKNGFTDTR